MSEQADGHYQVLARKHRPTSFAGLIGQDALVRTLTNAIGSGRIAHAFMLTGVRGVGKTTSARIIARALNCAEGPTAEPCGVCEHCQAIAEDRHVDVLEMDAASRTGVNDIRELIDGVRYRPTSARHKIYIIDEVHMLSNNAFNALLKTLEEPPEHVKFVFATTEIRKVPVTVLSRCQRFDLRRVDAETLAAHFKSIVKMEDAAVADGAVAMIARAADGSVRDGLSLLDQAIAHATGEVSEDQVRDMLGLADRTRTFDLLDAVMRGGAADALDMMAEQYAAGADPAVVLEDLLNLVHWLTRIRVAPSTADAPGAPEAERTRGKEMARTLSMPVLTRAWQMLLKGLGEVRAAPSPLQAAEMVLIRMAYASDLPTPEDALKALKDGVGAPPAPPPQTPPSPPAPPPQPQAQGALAPAPIPAHAPPAPEARDGLANPRSFEDVVALTEQHRESVLRGNLINNVHLVRFEPGLIEFHPNENADANLANELRQFLNDHTARQWMVAVSRAPGEQTLHQQHEASQAQAKARAADHPLVQAVMETFPGATIEAVRETAPVMAADEIVEEE